MKATHFIEQYNMKPEHRDKRYPGSLRTFDVPYLPISELEMSLLQTNEPKGALQTVAIFKITPKA